MPAEETKSKADTNPLPSSSEFLEVYKATTSRDQHEGDLFWTRFRLFGQFHAFFAGAVLAVMTLALDAYKSEGSETLNLVEAIQPFKAVLLAMGFFGAMTSLAWIQVMRNGWKWVQLSGEVLSKQERYLGIPEALSFYSHQKRSNDGFFNRFFDVCVVGTIVPWFFVLFFVGLVVLSLWPGS
jgi:hypothetical protein